MSAPDAVLVNPVTEPAPPAAPQTAATAEVAVAPETAETPAAPVVPVVPVVATPAVAAEAKPAAAADAAEPAPEAKAQAATEAKTEPATETQPESPAAAVPSEEKITLAPGWPAVLPSHPLVQLHARLPAILEAAGHRKMWGVSLAPGHFGTLIVLQKYLRSVSNDLEAAATNLQKTLAWRKEFGLDGEKEITVDGAQFEGLGYITNVGKEVVTWNVYGNVKDMKATFGDLDQFLHWRIALQENALARLHLDTTTVPVPNLGEGDDPHRIAQVHVYTGVSFLRMNPDVKAASKATIALFGSHYPETLSRKFFVGVPLIMSWVFTMLKVFVSAGTQRKFVVVSYETNLAAELGEKSDVPAAYGGTGPDLPQLAEQAERAERAEVAAVAARAE